MTRRAFTSGLVVAGLLASPLLLGGEGATAAPPPASKAAQSPIETALALIEASASDPSDAARDALVGLALDHPSVRIRTRAALALGERADAGEAVGSILWRWGNAGGARDVALRAAKALGRIPVDRSPRALWIRRQHEDATVELAVRAAWLATATGGPAVETMATWAKSDRSPLVRALSARALARVGADGAAIALLGAAAEERSELVRDALRTALASLPPDRVDRDLRARLSGARGEVRRHLLETVAIGPFDASAERLAAVKSALTTRIPAGVAAALAAAPAAPATIAAARERLASDDPVVRDAAIAGFVRMLATTPADLIAAAGDATVPMAARTRLLAALRDVPTEAARDALVAAAKTPVTREADLDVVATALGALRRSEAPGARTALDALRDGGGRVGELVKSIVRAQAEDTRPRAFVVQGRLDRAEECFEGLGWKVVGLPSANELTTIDATPEDAIVFDGPGEMTTAALVVLRRFLHLGGRVVLGAGVDNAAWRDLVPDALDAHPPNLKVEEEVRRRGRKLYDLRAEESSDVVVYAASDVDPTLAAALEPGPLVMVVPRPVPVRTVAARPLLWSAEMEVENGVTGCVAAEVRMGCGRILAIGAVIGLRGVDAAEGWFNRVRTERTPAAPFPTDEPARRRVAFDWFGLSPARIAELAQRGYFKGDDPASAMAELPAARFVDAWLRAR